MTGAEAQTATAIRSTIVAGHTVTELTYVDVEGVLRYSVECSCHAVPIEHGLTSRIVAQAMWERHVERHREAA